MIKKNLDKYLKRCVLNVSVFPSALSELSQAGGS